MQASPGGGFEKNASEREIEGVEIEGAEYDRHFHDVRDALLNSGQRQSSSGGESGRGLLDGRITDVPLKIRRTADPSGHAGE